MYGMPGGIFVEGGGEVRYWARWEEKSWLPGIVIDPY
jgi:hypothetical protein